MQDVTELKPVDLHELAEMAENCNAYRIFLHWTAGHYGQIYPDYHISIDHDGRIFLPYNCHDLDQYRQATYQRNSGSINIAVCGCFDACAEPYDLGSEPVTNAQIEALAAVVATICKHSGIHIDNVLTHCEIAKIDGYGPYSGDPETRWDLWFLPDYDGKMKGGGDVIRGKARWYLNYVD